MRRFSLSRGGFIFYREVLQTATSQGGGGDCFRPAQPCSLQCSSARRTTLRGGLGLPWLERRVRSIQISELLAKTESEE